MLAIRLPEEIEQRLKRLAKRTGRTESYYVRQAILEHLEDLEDVETADKRLEAFRTGKTRTVPLSRLLRKYGVDRAPSPARSSRKPRNGSGKN